MKKSEIITFLVLRTIGNFLVLMAIFGVFATFGPVLYYEALFRVEQYKGITYKVEENKTTQQVSKKDDSKDLFGTILANKKENILIPKDTLFSILIPKIGANAKIIPNVDPSSSANFLPALQKGVAHAKGSVFPGMRGNVYLFSHSTDNFWNVGRYNALFYLLKNLTPGDEIIIYYAELRHNYRVSEVKVVEANDISYLVDSQKQTEETLILQTCWPPGTTWKRLIVIAKPSK